MKLQFAIMSRDDKGGDHDDHIAVEERQLLQYPAESLLQEEDV